MLPEQMFEPLPIDEISHLKEMFNPEDVTEREKKVMEELERRIQDDLTPKLKEDFTLFYRFCKARDFNLDAAETMLRKHIAWRKEYNVDNILTDYTPPEIITKYASSSFVGFSKENYLVEYWDIGGSDLKGVLKSITLEDMIMTIIYTCEYYTTLMKQHSLKVNKVLYKLIGIHDMKNLSLAAATDRKVLEFGLSYLKLIFDNYPECLCSVFDINAPMYFTFMFNVLKAVIPATSLQKVNVIGSNGWKEELLKLIDADELPAFLGGNRTDPDGNPLCNTFIRHGEPVPKSYYICNRKKTFCEDSGEQQLNVKRLSREELHFEVATSDCTLEWNIQTKDRDIDFAVFFRNDRWNEELSDLLMKQRINSQNTPVEGTCKCDKPGTYTVVFDNSYSWIYSKEVFCRIRVKNAESQ